MNSLRLTLLLIIGVSNFSSVSATEDNKNKAKPDKPTVLKLQTTATDHNSTRSNRGSLVAPTEGNNINKQNTAQLIPKVMKLQATAGGHNSARSNKGQVVAPTEGNNSSKPTNQLIPKKGRNPQTGKEINIKSTKD